MSHSKLYIAVRDDFPDYMVPTLVAHSVLAAHIKFAGNSNYDEWLSESFKKCVVKVNAKEYEKIKSLGLQIHEGHENKTLSGRPSCIVIEPVYNSNIPNVLKFAKLWKP